MCPAVHAACHYYPWNGICCAAIPALTASRTESVARESEARLKEKEAEVAHAARFSLVSGMATALAHEINQPMAAVRALGRSVQELLRNPQVDLKRADQNLTRLIAEVDLASGILRRMRDFLRRGRPQKR